jgi:multiple sugar transport system substrate-binding protein
MSRRLPRTLGLVAAAALCVSVPTGALAQGTTITFLTPPWGVPPDQALLEAFQSESGITVEIQSVQIADLFSRVQVAAGAGTPAADVIFLTEEAPSNIIATGNVEPLDDRIAASGIDMTQFEQGDFWVLDGVTYGMPVYSQLVMLDHNAKRLADAGFTAGPTTWAELTDQARAIKEQAIDEYPISFGAIDWSWYLIALSMGDPMFDDQLNPAFADEGSKAREAMTLLLSWFAEGLITPEILSGATTQHSNFWAGTGTFHQGWQGSVAVGNNPETSTQAPDVAYLLLPEQHFTWSQPAAIGIGKGSPNGDAAWQFIEWYLTPENQTAIFDGFGLYPSRPAVADALNAEGKIAGYDIIVEQAKYRNELPRYTLWWGPFTETVSEQILTAAQTGGDANAVIDTLAEEWNTLKAEFE